MIARQPHVLVSILRRDRSKLRGMRQHQRRRVPDVRRHRVERQRIIPSPAHHALYRHHVHRRPPLGRGSVTKETSRRVAHPVLALRPQNRPSHRSLDRVLAVLAVSLPTARLLARSRPRLEHPKLVLQVSSQVSLQVRRRRVILVPVEHAVHRAHAPDRDARVGIIALRRAPRVDEIREHQVAVLRLFHDASRAPGRERRWRARRRRMRRRRRRVARAHGATTLGAMMSLRARDDGARRRARARDSRRDASDCARGRHRRDGPSATIERARDGARDAEERTLRID